jgi:beta-N-acetylhexosaminidase
MARRRALAAYMLLALPAYPAPTSERDAAQRWLRGMSLQQKVAQLVVITSYGEAPSSRSAAYREFVHAVRDLNVGGLIVINRVVGGAVRSAEPHGMASFLNRMQRLAKVPLLVGADFERGASMRVTGTAKFPHLMAYGAANDLELTRSLGAATAREARALGVHWVFAPVADVNSNPDNPIINIRSFGENPVAVASHVEAFIQGAHSDPANRVLVTAKHFPGHGDTSVDSHMGLARLGADRARMDAIELVPFRRAVNARVDAVMTAHMAVPAVEKEEIPATVSKNVMTGLLREDLQFSGLIVTDAMDMQGLTRQFPGTEAAIRALQAGVDVLLMPGNPEAVIKTVVAAVRDGRLSRKRIDESTLRVLAAKARVGLDRRRLVDVEQISDIIDSPELSESAQLAADKAVALIRNHKQSIPLQDPEHACLYVLAESRYGQQGRRLIDEVRTRSKKFRATLLDPQISKTEMEQHAGSAADCGTVIAAAFVTAAAYRGTVALAGEYPAFLQSLLSGRVPVVMIALGSPYLLRSFPQVSSYLATFSPALTAETAAVKALFGEIATTARLPVTIPGVANYGDGITSAARK